MKLIKSDYSLAHSLFPFILLNQKVHQKKKFNNGKISNTPFYNSIYLKIKVKIEM